MQVSIIGVGDMGRDIARHVKSRGFETVAFDIDPRGVENARALGIPVAASAGEAAGQADVHLLIVATGAQTEQVTAEILEAGRPGSTIVVLATNRLTTMQRLGRDAEALGFGFVDAPVCYGRKGAELGTLVSLCGGRAEVVEWVRPVLENYCRAVHHLGAQGAGQLAKT